MNIETKPVVDSVAGFAIYEPNALAFQCVKLMWNQKKWQFVAFPNRLAIRLVIY